VSITVVIPTYNSKALTQQLVKTVLEAGLKNILVFDDSSTDDTVSQLKSGFDSSIQIIVGTQNLGPGGNRNRCLEKITNNDDILLFIDADCELIYSGDFEKLITSNFEDEQTGVVGFTILNSLNEPMDWNYGDLMHPVHEASDQTLQDMWEAEQITKEQFTLGAPHRAASLRMLPETEPTQVGWVAEGCFAVRASLFKQLGGFSTEMRYHETHDFNARVLEAGYKTMFCPIALVRHLEFDSRMSRRDEDEREARLFYYRRHWDMGERTFKLLFDETEATIVPEL